MNVRNLSSLLSVCIVIVSLSVPLTAQDAKTTSTKDVSPTGTWEWDREAAEGKIHCVLKLTEKDGKVKGKFNNDFVEAKIENGTFKDGKLEVKFDVTVEDREFNVTLAGKVGEEKIEGKVLVNSDEGEEELEWVAIRTIGLDDVAGKWRMSFTTPDGVEMNPEFELKNAKGKPQIKFVEDDGMEISKVKFKNGNLKFTIELDYDGQPIKVEYDLELAGNQLDGMLAFYFKDSGDEGELDVEGSRIK